MEFKLQYLFSTGLLYCIPKMNNGLNLIEHAILVSAPTGMQTVTYNRLRYNSIVNYLQKYANSYINRLLLYSIANLNKK
jgi:hypothetical protein